jgi:phage/plasmid-associated DNA primase
MKQDTVQNGGKVEAIGNEPIYLRINQLQKGLLQFTDSCCPASPDSLEFCFAKLRTINSWSLRLRKLPSQKVVNFLAELYKTVDHRERCVQRPGAAIRARELFQVYQDWCDENNEMATSERMFGLRLKELGMVQKRTSEARFWQDLAVQA